MGCNFLAHFHFSRHMVIMVSTDVFSPSEAGLSRGRILSSPVSVQHSGVEVYKSEEGLIQQCSSEVHISTEQISHSLGFTAAQKTAFHNGCVDGESVVLLNSVVARSLGINAPSTGTNSDFSSTSLSVRQCLNLDESFNDGAVHGVLDVEDYGNTAYPSVMEEPLVDNSDEVNISVSEIDSDCMMDPDEFLEAGLASGKSEAVVDQDLTSLSWLQSKKLLRDVRVRPAVSSTPVPSPIHILPSSVVSPLPTSLVTSPTSRFDDTSLISVESSDQRVVPTDENTPDVQANENIECKEERLSKFQASSRQLSSPRGRVVSRRPNRRFPVSRMKRPPPYMSYNPRVDVTFKPPFSFSCLIFMAIEDSSMKALPVKEIYNWIMRSFPFYNNMCIGWKNSVRHNLSLNKCFCKVDSGRCSGKGSLWSIDPNYRPTLLYTLRRSSCVTEMPLSIDGHRLPWVSALQQSSPPSPIVSSNSQPLCENGSVCLNRCTGRQRFVKKNELSSAKLVSGGDTISNPELFPFLARRLRTDGGHVDHKLDQQQGLNGRQNTGLREGPHDVVENNVFSDRDCRDYGDEVRSQKHRSGRLNMRLVVIRHYPTDEHTYAIGHTESSVDSNMLEPPIARSSKVRANRKRRLVPSNVCARDMIGITGCSLSGSTAPVSAATVAASSRALQAAEASRRLVEEGADLLLNLAGMSRSQSPHPVPAPVSCSSRWQAETISSHVSTV